MKIASFSNCFQHLNVFSRHLFWNPRFLWTRKLSYRKDGRAMRPIIWVPWKFSRVPEYAHGYFSWIFNGLLFRSIVWMCVQNLKFIALPVPEIIGGTWKRWAVPGYVHAPFSQKKFNGLLFGWTLWMYRSNLKFVALPVPEIIAGTLNLWAVPG